MKILFVAMSNSIHTVRWISQISDLHWEIYLYPSQNINVVHELIRDMNVHVPFFLRNGKNRFIQKIIHLCRKAVEYLFDYETILYKYIENVQPDIIHTLETQSAGYLLMSVKNKYYKDKKFPIWVHSVWGSDIYLFGKLDDHRLKISEVLANCDYFFSESKRDIKLAKKIGFVGTVFPIIQAAGGFDFNYIKDICDNTPPSKRKCIILKGYQSWAGRALVGIRALELCRENLSNYKIIITLPNDDVILSAKLFSEKYGISIEIIPNGTPHHDMLRLYNQARIFVGLSISDGVPNSLLEAMVMGAFPVQSYTSCADEWLKDGLGGFLVPPEDPVDVAKAIKKALKDDVLVDKAQKLNWIAVNKRLNYNSVKNKVVDSYSSIFGVNKSFPPPSNRHTSTRQRIMLRDGLS